MFTKPLIRQSLAALDISDDLSSIRRMLMAAALSPRFCAGLLNAPSLAAQKGFGGEQFPMSVSTLNILDSIRVATLPEFIQQLDEHLSDRLLSTGELQVTR